VSVWWSDVWPDLVMVLHGTEAVVSRDQWRAMAERAAAAAPALAEHTRDRGDECACDRCAADDLELPPMEAALRHASLVGDRAAVARLRVAIEAARRRRRG